MSKGCEKYLRGPQRQKATSKGKPNPHWNWHGILHTIARDFYERNGVDSFQDCQRPRLSLNCGPWFHMILYPFWVSSDSSAVNPQQLLCWAKDLLSEMPSCHSHWNSNLQPPNVNLSWMSVWGLPCSCAIRGQEHRRPIL